jgi:hypothetical protein
MKHHEQLWLMRHGAKMSDAEAAELETAVAADQSDLHGRIKLIGFYCDRRSEDATRGTGVDPRLFEHWRWLLERQPHLSIKRELVFEMCLCDSDQMFALYKLLLDVLERNPEHSLALVSNACWILDCVGPDKDRVLYEQLRREFEQMQEARFAERKADGP